MDEPMKVCPHCRGAYPVAEGYCPMDGTRLRTMGVGAPPQPADAWADALLGSVLDRRYRLDGVIGEGGMGLVFRATHVLIGKPLAVKLLRREHIESADVARRFLLEARVASSLKHPNVVEISDFGELPDGGAYYVMELLEGRTLATRIDQDGLLAPPDAVVCAAQICAGLSAAHGLGIVHRDLKPDNVFLADGRHAGDHPTVKLLDFGIARAGPRRITVSGAVLGTPEYMSPEMAQGQDVDHRADLYALGVMLFEMLTGTVPFYHKEVAKTLEMHVFAPRPTIASRKPELARLVRIGELVDAMLAIQRDQRPRDADEVMRALRAAWAHDLDADSVAVVQRATLAIGSGRMPELDGAPRRDWPAPRDWPAGQIAGDPSRPIALGATPPEPRVPTYVLSPPRAKPSQLRAAMIAVSTAAIACAITLGIAKWVQTPSATAAESVAPIEATPAIEEAAIAPAVAEPASDPQAEPPREPKPEVIAPAVLQTPATPNPGVVIPVAPPPTPSDEKSAGLVDRSKNRRRRVAEPTGETSGASASSPPAPAATDRPPPPPDPAPSAHETRLPGDLKDPFPGK